MLYTESAAQDVLLQLACTHHRAHGCVHRLLILRCIACSNSPLFAHCAVRPSAAYQHLLPILIDRVFLHVEIGMAKYETVARSAWAYSLLLFVSSYIVHTTC